MVDEDVPSVHYFVVYMFVGVFVVTDTSIFDSVQMKQYKQWSGIQDGGYDGV